MPISNRLNDSFRDGTLLQWVQANVEDPMESLYLTAWSSPILMLVDLRFRRYGDAIACRLTFGD